MSETVSLKRPRSESDVNFQTEEPDEKYSIHAGNHQQLMMNPAVMAGMPNARGLQPNVGFPLMQYCQMIQQMQHHHQQMEYPMPMIRKDNKDEANSASTTPSSSRRQTLSAGAAGPRPIRVPPQSIFNPMQFGMMPLSQQQIIEEPSTSPTTMPRQQSDPHTYHMPSFQRADEEIYTKFVDSVRKLAAKLAAERS
ncbi:Mediator of RNA polymerase II transcription subunit 7 [Caenorhabditis elegans]|uniref:Mediator of RNA polymerase II transcription subunit 7 n=3 Tax=Caenorhabditis elegans TaxID=6239 RepID=U4PEN8_CAEEL|nr:Mediator of RNA polymerase II transcription subunit 7 [Caenorhabditis elegans]CDH93197.1 Mediator of RNA polymerase II transcription subunit 7 [Caenorhabditis elegans]|eukprot:NP_001294427.1 Uncharacterized protein CELE_M01H9.4 [Caenorhabditis elegans]